MAKWIQIMSAMLFAMLCMPQARALDVNSLIGLYQNDHTTMREDMEEATVDTLSILAPISEDSREVTVISKVLGDNGASCSVVGLFQLSRDGKALVMTTPSVTSGNTCQMTITQRADGKLVMHETSKVASTCQMDFCGAGMSFENIGFSRTPEISE